MFSVAEIVVTETYSEGEYGYTFPSAEVGFPLQGEAALLEQCVTGSCDPVTGAPSVTGSLPAGMKVVEGSGGDVELSGYPRAGSEGAYQFEITVGDNIYSCGLQVVAPLSLNEDPADPSTFHYEVGSGFSGSNIVPFEVDGGLGASPVSLVAAPPWLQLAYNAAGTQALLFVTGTDGGPQPGSTYTFSLETEDGYHYPGGPAGPLTSRTLNLEVAPKLVLTTPTLVDGEVGTHYSDALSTWASGGTGPYTWSLDTCATCGTLPPGLSLDQLDGTISGDPTTSADYSFVVVLGDADGATAVAPVTISIGSTQPLQIATTSLPSATTDHAYSTTLSASGGTSPDRWSITSGSLPVGLILSSSGAISGTPTGSGTSSFSVQVTDSAGATATRSLSITVEASCPPKVCSPPSPPRR